MAEPPINKTGETQQDTFEEMAKFRSELGVPGYWKNLHENCVSWAPVVGASRFWSAANSNLHKWRNEYYEKTSGPLLSSSKMVTSPQLPDFEAKGIERIQEKIHSYYRRTPSDGCP